MASQFSLIKVTIIILSLFLLTKQTKSQLRNNTFSGTISDNCLGTCGEITIPYPFGIGDECAYDSTFNISCEVNTSFQSNPYLTIFDFPVRVIRIAPFNVMVDIPSNGNNLLRGVNTNNYFPALNWFMPGNFSQTSRVMPGNVNQTSNGYGVNTICRNIITRGQRVHFCNCDDGYEGNPYLPHGCRDINECERNKCRGEGSICQNHIGSYSCTQKKNRTRIIGITIGASLGGILLLVVLWWMFKVIKKLKKAKLKKKLFKRNGGLLLQQQLASGDDGTVEKTKLFTSEELDKATDHYNDDRILGRGGQGTVYKGMLNDGRIVAIKMSMTVDEANLEQFINEVVILSQINHRNVVKLHGCCLETEVPLLVYEFISNGTLSQYIHDQEEEFELSWDVRMRIATEVASALSYLHCAASFPIYHRDMKSSNILLDEKYRAKVADFGTSRSIAIDQTHLTTRVLGTFGYLDPEYFQTGQFTGKSDVYSFGVVLVELLTGQQPIFSSRPDESRSLATYFMVAMEENKLMEILDARVEKNKMILDVAKLAKRCLSLDVRKRPTMKEVAVELDGIRMSSSTGASKEEPHIKNVEQVKLHISGPILKSTSSLASSYEDNSIILDVQPLISR